MASLVHLPVRADAGLVAELKRVHAALRARAGRGERSPTFSDVVRRALALGLPLLAEALLAEHDGG